MKKLLLTLIVIMSCICIYDDVHAESEEHEYLVYGTVEFYYNGFYYTDTYDISYTSDKPIAAYLKKQYKNNELTQYYIYISCYRPSGDFYFESILGTVFYGGDIYAERRIYNDVARTSLYKSESLLYVNYILDRTYETVDFHTSIPLFDSQEEAEAFLRGEKTEKDALNYESDLCNIKYDLEVPQNMKAVRDEGLFTGALKFTWTQSAEGYEEWETEFYVFQDFKYRSSFLTLSLADWKYAEKFYLFTEYVDTRKLYFRSTEEIFEKHDVQRKRSEAYPCDYGGYYEPLVDEYYIRNHYFDGDTHHYSNWVVVSFDYESGDIVTTIKELEGSEIEHDENGNVVVGTTNQNQNSQYGDGYDIYSEESSSDIVNFIKSGFGLLGEDGVLTLLSQTFSFIPTELWSVFIAGMALMVLIAIAKFVRG